MTRRRPAARGNLKIFAIYQILPIIYLQSKNGRYIQTFKGHGPLEVVKAPNIAPVHRTWSICYLIYIYTYINIYMYVHICLNTSLVTA